MISIISIFFICVLVLNKINCEKNLKQLQYSIRNFNDRQQPLTTTHIVTYPESVEEKYYDESSSIPQSQKQQQHQRQRNSDKNNINENVIPLDLLEQINNVNNASQFFDEFIDHESMSSREILSSRFSDDNIERMLGVVARPAGCTPESTVVPLEPLHPSKDPTVIYFPSCTRVKRCSGCCSSSLLSCQPTKIQTLTFLVYKSQYTGGPKMAFRGKEAILVDQHEECKCDCRIKESDCNAYQVYEASQCKCLCANFDEQSKCLTQSEKVWDSNNCRCRCRIPGNCTTGTYFDEQQCRCLPISNGFQSELPPVPTPFFDRRKFIVKAIPVDPSDNTRYDSTPYNERL